MTTSITIFGEGLKRIEDRKACTQQEDVVCSICFENISNNQYTSKCGHCFCKECIFKWLASKYYNKSSRTCPLCRSNIEEDIVAFKFEICESCFDISNSEDFLDKLSLYIHQNFDFDKERVWIHYILPEVASKDIKLFLDKTLYEIL